MIEQFTGEHWFLSNFSPSPITLLGGINYPTMEHFFQAAKTLDYASKVHIAAALTPGEAKRRGRHVQLRPDWETVKLSVMREGLELKFAPGTSLASRLLSTGDQLLVEGNKWGDRFWGRVDGHGQNWLGHLLMARRSELRGLA